MDSDTLSRRNDLFRFGYQYYHILPSAGYVLLHGYQFRRVHFIRIIRCGHQSAASHTRSAGAGSHHPPDLPGAGWNSSAERAAGIRNMDSYPLARQHNIYRYRDEYHCFRP